MPGTTTPADIKAINGSTEEDAVVLPFATASNCIMANIDVCRIAKGVTDDCADTAAAWLGAHLMGMSSVGEETLTKKKEKFEDYSVELIVGGFSGKGVLSTTYGQTANMLTAGCLQEQDKAPANVFFFG